MSPALTVLVMAKSPLPGRVKTRLCPPFTQEEAAALAEAALIDTLSVVRELPAGRRVLALDGPVGSWLPPGIDVIAQHGAGLDERIADAMAQVSGPMLLLGMDTPQVRPDQVRLSWAEHDAWLGPALDGGFWALALADPRPELVRGVAMSRPDTGAVQLDRLRCAGLRVGTLPTLRDVDTAQCAAAVAALAPDTRFAALHAALAALPAR